MEDLIRQFAQEPIFIILGLVVLGLVILHFATRSRQRPTSRSWLGRSSTGRGADPLVTACLGDRNKADRLMQFELKRAPGLSHAEARKRAHERLADDRR